MSGEFEGLDGLRRKFDRQLHLIAARRVVALDGRRCVGKRSEISRTLAVVEDDLLVKLFDVHAKKAWILRRISAMRMTSSEVL